MSLVFMIFGLCFVMVLAFTTFIVLILLKLLSLLRRKGNSKVWVYIGIVISLIAISVGIKYIFFFGGIISGMLNYSPY